RANRQSRRQHPRARRRRRRPTARCAARRGGPAPTTGAGAGSARRGRPAARSGSARESPPRRDATARQIPRRPVRRLSTPPAPARGRARQGGRSRPPCRRPDTRDNVPSASRSTYVSQHDTGDFAALFAASIRSLRFETGQTVEGTIVAIGPEVAFVDVGDKGEATLAVADLTDENGEV